MGTPRAKDPQAFLPEEFELVERLRAGGHDLQMSQVDRLIATLKIFFEAQANQAAELEGTRAQTAVLHALMARYPRLEFSMPELKAAQEIPADIRFSDVPPVEEKKNGILVMTPQKLRVERIVRLAEVPTKRGKIIKN